MTTARKNSIEDLELNIGHHASEASAQDILKSLEDETIKSVTLNFSGTLSIDKSFYQFIYKLKRDLFIKKIELKSKNLNQKLRQQLQNDGTESFFNIVRPTAKSVIDVKFVQPFINSTVNVLKVQTQVDSTMLTPTIKSKFTANYEIDIAGVLSLVSPSFSGSVGICYPKSTFLKICGKLFDQEYETIDSEVEDAASEILNMIFGGAKAELNKDFDYGIQKALPTVIRADSLKLRQYSAESTLVIPFDSSVGPFHIEIEAVYNTKE